MMFEIKLDGENDVVSLHGRLDAVASEKAKALLDEIESSAVVDFAHLDYISSAGLGVLFATQRRLMDDKKGLRLVNLSKHIRDVFELAGFDTVFEMEQPGALREDPTAKEEP